MAEAGWYDDGQHPGHERYWDGKAWTEHFLPPLERPAHASASPVPDDVELNLRDWQSSDDISSALHHARTAAAADDYHAELVAVDAARQAARSSSDATRQATTDALERQLARLRAAGALHGDFRMARPRSREFRNGLEALIGQLLRRASAASARRDVRLEGHLTEVALRRAAEIGGPAAASRVERTVRSMQQRGELLTGSTWVGVVPSVAAAVPAIEVRSDRVRQGRRMQPITRTTWAQVYRDGHGLVTADPWTADGPLSHPLPRELRGAAFHVGADDWSMHVGIPPDQAMAAKALAERVQAIAAEAMRRSLGGG